jgi:Dolichyl-phosphate-mannose-protein mannosyltransferase
MTDLTALPLKARWRAPSVRPGVICNQDIGVPVEKSAASSAAHSDSMGRITSLRIWLQAPSGRVVLLILTTFMIRMLFAASLGLGIDESYMVAAGRSVQLSYFDHPPLAWWMAWGAAKLAGTDAPWVVRLPFVLTFAGTTWLMFRLTARLFGEGAGFWAAILVNLSPVFGVTTGSWVLPDGPLVAALLAAAICLVQAIKAQAHAAWRWWLGAGVCLGLAMMSKYTAVLTALGAVVFLLSQPSARRWLARPHPYAAGLLALAIFFPALVWNAEHQWASLLFQGGRAHVSHLHVFGPLATLGGEALFLLPWIWLPAMVCGMSAAWQGRHNEWSWLLSCLAFPPIILFLVISMWTHVLFHWAAPGYLMLFPLLGDAVQRCQMHRHAVRRTIAATAAVVAASVALVASEVRFNWLPEVGENFAFGKDPDLDLVDWTSVNEELARKGFLGHRKLIVAATRWSDAGKIDYALEGRTRVICLGPDPREYGVTTRPEDYVGDDVLIVAPRTSLAQVRAKFETVFDSVAELPPVLLWHAGRPAMLIPLFLGRHFHTQPTRAPGDSTALGQ